MTMPSDLADRAAGQAMQRRGDGDAIEVVVTVRGGESLPSMPPHLPRLRRPPPARGRSLPGAARPVCRQRLPRPLRGPDPAHVDRASGRSPSTAPSTPSRTWSWDQLRELPSETFTTDIHCVTKWTQARHDLDRRVARHAARGGRDRGRVPDRLVRRRLHDQPHDRGHQRRQGVDRLRLRRRAARPRARRPGAAARPAPVPVEEREVDPRHLVHALRTSRASGRPRATTTTATRGGSSGTGTTDGPPRAGPVARRACARSRRGGRRRR